jgi:hypothetical protein
MTKALKKLEIKRGVYLNIMKAIYDNSVVNIVLNEEKLKAIPLK